MPGQQKPSSHPFSRSAERRALFFPQPTGPNFFSGLAAELYLNILEYLDAEDILALRTASPRVRRALEKGRHSSRLWRRVQIEAGLPVEEGQQRPTPDELVKIFYVLENHCMACGAVPAYRQWEFGFRLCSSCLIPRITSFKDFMTDHGEMFTDWGVLQEALPWLPSGFVPGILETMGPSVTRKTWGDQVVERLKDSMARRKPKQLRKDKERISSSMIDGLKISQAFSTSLVPLKPKNILNAAALNRLARQRQAWFVAQLLGMSPQKFILPDIPKLQDVEWRRIMYKQSEPGMEAEWSERQTRLRLMARTRRNNRLAVLLRNHPPPLPCTDHAEYQKSNQDISHHHVGSLPAVVFLKICMLSDVNTAITMERVCTAASFILGSSAAESTWRQLRLAAGLEAKYAGWSERRFLSLAFRKLCHCGSEGVTLWTFATTLCGDCFSEHVIRADEVPSDVSRDLKRAMPSLHPDIYDARRWLDSKADGVRLLSRDYVATIQGWISQIPSATRAQIPADFPPHYLEEGTVEFREVVKKCEKWQEKCYIRMGGVRRRREIAITQKIQIQNPDFKAPSDLWWTKLVNQPHPLSEREWKTIRDKVLKIGRVG